MTPAGPSKVSRSSRRALGLRPFCCIAGLPGGIWGPVDLGFASALLGVSLDAILAKELPPERSKALLAQLIEEVRVVTSADVRVTYRVPLEVAYRMEWWR